MNLSNALFSRSIYRFVPTLVLALAGVSFMSAAQAESRFVISADGKEVTDTQTKLVWQRCAVGQTWDGKVCVGKAAKVGLAKAKEMGIPTRTEPELVEFLMQLKLNELVPPKLYAAVAEVLAWA